MKSNYESPEITVIQLELESVPICSMSGGALKSPMRDLSNDPAEEG